MCVVISDIIFQTKAISILKSKKLSVPNGLSCAFPFLEWKRSAWLIWIHKHLEDKSRAGNCAALQDHHLSRQIKRKWQSIWLLQFTFSHIQLLKMFKRILQRWQKEGSNNMDQAEQITCCPSLCTSYPSFTDRPTFLTF